MITQMGRASIGATGTDSAVHHDASNIPRGFHGLLGSQRWDALISYGFPRTHRPGEYLLRQEEKGGYLFALTGGRVKVLAREADGSQLLLSLRGSGDLVGEMAARKSTRRTATVQALDSCTSSYLSRSEFDRFLRDHDVNALFSDYLVSKLSETVPYQVQQVHFRPRQRVARLLLEAFCLADQQTPDRWKVPFSQEALAQALGMARSTVADQLAALRSTGALGPGPRIVVADDNVLANQARTVSR